MVEYLYGDLLNSIYVYVEYLYIYIYIYLYLYLYIYIYIYIYIMECGLKRQTRFASKTLPHFTSIGLNLNWLDGWTKKVFWSWPGSV